MAGFLSHMAGIIKCQTGESSTGDAGLTTRNKRQEWN